MAVKVEANFTFRNIMSTPVVMTATGLAGGASTTSKARGDFEISAELMRLRSTRIGGDDIVKTVTGDIKIVVPQEVAGKRLILEKHLSVRSEVVSIYKTCMALTGEINSELVNNPQKRAPEKLLGEVKSLQQDMKRFMSKDDSTAQKDWKSFSTQLSQWGSRNAKEIRENGMYILNDGDIRNVESSIRGRSDKGAQIKKQIGYLLERVDRKVQDLDKAVQSSKGGSVQEDAVRRAARKYSFTVKG